MLIGHTAKINVITTCLAIVAFTIGSIELACLWAYYYPSADNLNRLYAAVYLSLPISIFSLYWSLLANNFKQLLIRGYSWVILLTLLLFSLAKV